MFRKKGIEGPISNVREHFSYLFKEGFQIVASQYDHKHFGNWILVLSSDKCVIRMIQDRGQIVLLIGPPWVATALEDVDHYYDLRLLMAFLDKTDVIDFTADLQHIEVQYRKLSSELRAHYGAILELLSSPVFPNIENELRELRNRILAKRFPQLFGGNR